MNTDKILVVGPNYKDHKGGIGAVIALYKHHMPGLQVMASYDGNRSGMVNALLFPLVVLKFIAKIISNKNIELIHIHGASNGSFYRKYILFTCSRILGKKTIYHIHGGGFHDFYNRSGKRVQKAISSFMARTDCVVCLSASWQAMYEQTFKVKRLNVLPNFVDIPHTKGQQKEKVIFLFLGKIMVAKGIYDLLEVAKNLKQHYPGRFELWIGGNGETQKLSQVITGDNIGDCVKFLGWIDREQKEKVLAEADIYVLPSYAEAMPVSILEAMAGAMPVIASRAGGIPEVVADGNSGYLINAGDQAALYNCMAAFLNNRNLITAMGQQSLNIIREKFETSVVLKQLNTIYDQLLSPQT